MQGVPDLLDLGQRHAAEVGRRLLGQPRREADAQAAGQQLEQRPAAVGVQGVEPALDQRLRLQPRGAGAGASTTSESSGSRLAPGRAGQTRATVSARSPT